jgi:hypothetical protein
MKEAACLLSESRAKVANERFSLTRSVTEFNDLDLPHSTRSSIVV